MNKGFQKEEMNHYFKTIHLATEQKLKILSG